MINKYSFRQKLMLSMAFLFRRFPNFKGKVRALLWAYHALDLEKTHFFITTKLHHPVTFKINLDLYCKHEKMAFFMDYYESSTVDFLLRLYQKGRGGYFLDVGANIGLISIPFACKFAANKRKFKTASEKQDRLVYCIEAVEANFRALASNIILNQMEKKITAIGVAVGEREKDVDIQVEGNQKKEGGTGTANIIDAESNYICERIPLHVITIDNLLDKKVLPANCSLIKVDTDGYDFFVLMGAKNLLKSSRPIIFGEFMAHCLKWHHQTIYDVQEFLTEFGYDVYIKKERFLFKKLNNKDIFVQDAICIPTECAVNLDWCIM